MDARFQVCFTPLAGVLFAFPSRYLSTIGHHGVLRLGGWSPRIRTGFHVSRPTWDPGWPGRAFGYGAFTRCGRTFQSVRLASPVPCPGPATPDGKPSGLAWCAFARHYSRNRVCFPLLQVLRCFTSLGVAPCGLSLFIRRRPPSQAAGLPHSDTPGSKPVDGSPRIVAVFRVLLRLMTPRHPSCARIRLARNFLASRLRCNSLQFQSSGFQGSSRRARCAHVAANGCIVYQTHRTRARGKMKKS